MECFLLAEISVFLASQHEMSTFLCRSASSASSFCSLSSPIAFRGDSSSGQLSFSSFLLLYFLCLLSQSFFFLLVVPTLTPSIQFFRCFCLIFFFLPFSCQFPLPLVFPLPFCFFSLPFFFFVKLSVAQLIENTGYILYAIAIATKAGTRSLYLDRKTTDSGSFGLLLSASAMCLPAVLCTLRETMIKI